MTNHHSHLIPHGVPATRRNLNNGNGGILFATSKQCFLVLATAIPSFLLGTTVALYARLDTQQQQQQNANVACADNLEAIIQARVVQAVAAEKADWLQDCKGQQVADASSLLLDSKKVGNYVTSIALTPKTNLTKHIDLGVPLDPVTKGGSTHAMILYMKQGDNKEVEGQVLEIPNAAQALEPCDTVHVLLTDHSGKRNQCLALVPNYESYYLQRWMRVNDKQKQDSTAPLQLVGRGLKGNGADEFRPPTMQNAQKAVDFMKKYFNSLDDVLGELRTILQSIAGKEKTVIVMVCNFGQSELLMNFICQARARNFDISMILVFATDQETYDIVKGLGVAAYYDKRVRLCSFSDCLVYI